MPDEVFLRLLLSAEVSAVHLEMRDGYDTTDDPDYADWRAGRPFTPDHRWQAWQRLIAAAVDRGVGVRRARVVSEPVSEYIRYEYDLTGALNIPAGEQIRWLPRRHATALSLPGNDFWVFDGTAGVVNHFAGDGSWVDEEEITDGDLVRHLASAFEAVWDHAVDHVRYRPG